MKLNAAQLRAIDQAAGPSKVRQLLLRYFSTDEAIHLYGLYCYIHGYSLLAMIVKNRELDYDQKFNAMLADLIRSEGINDI